MWLNKSVATITATLKLLDKYIDRWSYDVYLQRAMAKLIIIRYY